MTGNLDQRHLAPLKLDWNQKHARNLRLAHRIEADPVDGKQPPVVLERSDVPVAKALHRLWWSRLVGRVGRVEGGALLEFRGGSRPAGSPSFRSRLSSSVLLWTFFLALGLAGFERGNCAHREVSTHAGMANASAVAVLSEDFFAAASDEDNVLRIYKMDADGAEVGSLDVSEFMSVRGHSTEVDMEGAARVGDLVYWIGSHSRNKDGKVRPNRHRLFATQIATNGASIRLVPFGRPCGTLLDALIRNDAMAKFGLNAASSKAPEDGGLNIEGMAAGPNGELWLGFRSPIPNGKALVVPLLNPAEVLQLQYPKFGPAKQLDLDGLGIRDMTWTGREWYLIAGRAGSGGNARLYRWSGGDAPPERVEKAGFKNFNPEALASVGSGRHVRLLTLSDDGNAAKWGKKQFRSFWVDP